MSVKKSKETPKPKGEVDEIDEIDEIDEVDEVPEDPPKRKKPEPLFPPQPKVAKSKSDAGESLQPVVDAINTLNDRLAKAFPDPTEPPPPESKPEPRKYRLFDEFDPTLEG